MKPDAVLFAQQADHFGQLALVLFLLMLALLLAATCVGWWFLQHRTVPARLSTVSLTTVPGLPVAAGVAVILIGVGVFAALALQLQAGDGLERTDQALTDALFGNVPPLAQQAFALLSHLADTATLTGLCIVVAMALVALRQRRLALGWVVAVAGNGMLNESLKQIFGRVRPLHPDALGLAQGFSFPSGHSSGAVVAYGMLTYVALRLLPARWHLPSVLAAELIVFSVGASRLFLGVHFASDVIAGFGSGAAWLALCVTLLQRMRREQHCVRHHTGH